MPHAHLEAESRCYFVTTNVYGRESLFLHPETADIVVRTLYHLRSAGRIKLHAFVLMPDHLHFIASLAIGEALPKLMHSLKSYAAKEINRCLGKKGKVWQRGFYSHGVRNEKDILEKISYLMQNPVKARLCDTVEEYWLRSANEAYEIDPY